MRNTFEATTTDETQAPEPIRIPTTRRERRESAQELTVSTWHNRQFGVWRWSELTERERQDYTEAQRRNQYVALFGIYA